MVLKQEEIDACREAFLAFDKDRSGTIDVWELRQVLEELGQAPTEDELFQVRGQREIWGDIAKREKRESELFLPLPLYSRTHARRNRCRPLRPLLPSKQALEASAATRHLHTPPPPPCCPSSHRR